MNTADTPSPLIQHLTSDRARRLAWLALAVYLIVLAVAATVRSQGDFAVYYRAGQRALAGVPQYPPQDSSKFLYAPIFAIGFVPFAILPVHIAQLAWFVLNAVALIALIFGCVRMLFGRERRLDAALILIPVLFTARFIDNNVEHGQINIATAALIVWAIESASEEHPGRAGFLLGTAVLIKPFALLGGWYLVLDRKWPALIWAAVAVAVLLLLPAIFYGPHAAQQQTLAYVRAVSSMGSHYREMLTNQSASSASIRLFAADSIHQSLISEDVASLVGLAFHLLLVAVVSIWILKARFGDDPEAERLSLGALFCLMPSFAPVSWKSYYVILLVPYMALLSALWLDRPNESKRAWAAQSLFTLSVVLNLLGGRNLNHLALFYSVHFWSSLAAFGALAALALSRSSSSALAVEPLREGSGSGLKG